MSTSYEELNQQLDLFFATALRIKKERDMLLAVCKQCEPILIASMAFKVNVVNSEAWIDCKTLLRELRTAIANAEKESHD